VVYYLRYYYQAHFINMSRVIYHVQFVRFKYFVGYPPIFIMSLILIDRVASRPYSLYWVMLPQTLKIEQIKPSLVMGRSLVRVPSMESHIFSFGLALGDWYGYCILLTPLSSYRWAIWTACAPMSCHF